MYATEFWIDYFLEHLKLDLSLLLESDFFTLSDRLAKQFGNIESESVAKEDDLSNPRLADLRQKHYPLYKMAQVVLLEKSKMTLEVESVHGIIPPLYFLLLQSVPLTI
jgi:hypothetical protein